MIDWGCYRLGQRSQQQSGYLTLIKPPLVEIRENVVPRFMAVETLSWEADARASIYPSKTLSTLKNAPRTLSVSRSSLARAGRKQTALET